MERGQERLEHCQARHQSGYRRAHFEGPVLTDVDARFNYGEVREISIGKVADAVVVAVVHTQRDGKIRLISARRANRGERKRYEEALRTRTQS